LPMAPTTVLLFAGITKNSEEKGVVTPLHLEIVVGSNPIRSNLRGSQSGPLLKPHRLVKSKVYLNFLYICKISLQ